MLFKNITLLDENLNIKENICLAIKADKIAYIGYEIPKMDFGRVYEGVGKLVIPAFINTHAHTPMALLRGYGENMNLQDWLFKKIFPFEDRLSSNDVYYASLLGFAEMLKYGTVSTTDMYMFGEDILRAVIESGVKCNFDRPITAFKPNLDLENLPAFKESEILYKKYHNAENGRIKIDMGIHAEYTSNAEVVKEIAAYCKSIGTNMNLHLSETRLEHEECKARHNGMTPAQYFDSLGVFENSTTAAHCVWIEDCDREIFKAKGVTVASCPVSNLKLASGVCDVKKLFDMGINVALGTDSVASNNNLDMIEEMKFFALLNKGFKNDPTVITPKQAVLAATLNGAKAQGRTDCGALKLGNKADLCVFDLNRANFQPIHDVLNNLVYAASAGDIVLTMADGKVLYENGKYTTIDLEKTVYEVNAAKARILSEL